MVADFARFYGEGGFLLAIPNKDSNRSSLIWGGYGHFGFEFFTGTQSSLSYFLEVGGTGSTVTLNGLHITVGFRLYPGDIPRSSGL